MEPGQSYELRIPIVPTARLLQVGERIALRLKAADEEPPKIVSSYVPPST